MSCYLGNYFAPAGPSKRYRAGGFANIVSHPWAPVPQGGPDGCAVLVHEGAGYYSAVAPGFEGALDAPAFIPNGSMQAIGFQPYSD